MSHLRFYARATRYQTLFSFLAFVLMSMQAQSGGFSHCERPFVFGGSDVNVVVLPYVVTGPNAAFKLQPDNTAVFEIHETNELAGLIQSDLLFSLRYPASLAVVNVIPDGAPCAVDDLEARLLDQIEPGAGLVFVWGSFIVDEDRIYVRNYARAVRRDRSDVAEIPVRFNDFKSQFFAKPMQVSFGFPPREVTIEDIQRIAAASKDVRNIYAVDGGNEPMDVLPKEPNPDAYDQGFGYRVLGLNPATGYMEIQPFQGSTVSSGWVKAKSEWPLRQRLPELDYVDALVGYLAAQIALEDRGELPVLTAETIQSRLQRFQRTSRKIIADGPDFETRVSLAHSALLDGLVKLLWWSSNADTGPDADLIQAALSDFRTADEYAPFYAEVKNLEAIALASSVNSQEDNKEISAAIAAWRSALSLDPANTEAGRNLLTFYRLLQATGMQPDAGISPAALEARITNLRAAFPQ